MLLTIKYNWRNLWVRKLSSGLTFLVVATLILILSYLLAFAGGVQAAIEVTGWPQNLIVLKPGATAESTSIIVPTETSGLVQTPGVARNAAGEMLISQEMSVQTDIPRRGGGGKANVAVRGVDPIALDVHPEVRITEGRMFDSGAMEALVGKAARERYVGLNVGEDVAMGRSKDRLYKIVGVFEARGGAYESEIWAPRTRIADSYQRPLISSASLRLERPDLAAAAIDYVNGPAIKLSARSEPAYYKELATSTAQLAKLALSLVFIMGVGAVFAVANTMFASVDRRRREIAMLRTIGFSRATIITSFLAESVLLCTLAAGVGVLASLWYSGSRDDYLSATTYTVFAFEVRVTPMVVIMCFALAALVGLVGAFFPALRAARVQIIEALRKA